MLKFALAFAAVGAAFAAIRSRRHGHNNEELVTQSGEPIEPSALLTDVGASKSPEPV